MHVKKKKKYILYISKTTIPLADACFSLKSRFSRGYRVVARICARVAETSTSYSEKKVNAESECKFETDVIIL